MVLAQQPAPPPPPSPIRALRADPFALWCATSDSVLVVPVLAGARLRVPGRFGLRFSAELPEVLHTAEETYRRGAWRHRGHLVLDDDQVALFALPPADRGSAPADHRCCSALGDALAELSAAVRAAPLLVVPPLDDVAYGLPVWQTCRGALAANADPRAVFCRP